MRYQWYPGHMTKAKRMMQENISLIDLVIELIDARIPLSSRNPDIDELGKNKARLILLNKSDLADERANKLWMEYFRKQDFHVLEINARSGKGLKAIQGMVREACKEKIERDRRRGIRNRPVRAIVVGIPNVGKSTFINSYAGKACAKTGNKPGVTRGNQWIRLNKTLELLDTPGILWPRFENQEVGVHLALIGSINDEILDKEELALKLINFLNSRYPQVLKERFGEALGEEGGDEERQDMIADPAHDDESLKVLKSIARIRGCLVKGSGYDLKKAANLLLDDFRGGKLGRITLEFPPA